MTGWIGSSKTPAGKVVLSKDQWQMLAKLAQDNEYWKTAHNFMVGVKGHELSSLSVKQLDWYYNIDAGLDVEINRHEGRIAFGLETEDE